MLQVYNAADVGHFFHNSYFLSRNLFVEIFRQIDWQQRIADDAELGASVETGLVPSKRCEKLICEKKKSGVRQNSRQGVWH
jgi:hypothetical protein